MSIDLKTLFNLPKQINLILPSKTKNGLDINLDLIIEEFLLKMTKIFGGCNIQNNITGAFKMQDGSIMIENNAIIEAFCEENKDLKDFLELCLYLKSQYQQEAVAFKINGVLYFC